MRLIRYFFVGGAAAAVDIGLFFLFAKVLGFNYLLVGAGSFLIATAVNYVLGVRHVFESGVRFTQGREIILVLLVSTVGLAVNQTMLFVCVSQFQLDKLFANAGDFRVPGTAIELMLLVTDDHWLLRVSNQGPPLPESMRDNLFQSMVSVRARREEGTPHLGLGLYIARLITEFHGGRIDADNLPAGAGVSFSMRFPLSPGNAPVASAGC